MSAAINAKTASQRAQIARRLFLRTKPWPQGHGLGRSFDDCFEMSDGTQVKLLLLQSATKSPELRAAMHLHGYSTWAERAERGETTPTPDEAAQLEGEARSRTRYAQNALPGLQPNPKPRYRYNHTSGQLVPVP